MARGEFPTSITAGGKSWTLSANTVPQWALHKLRFYTNKYNSTNFDATGVAPKIDRNAVHRICERFGT